MATVETVLKRILRATGQNPAITSASLTNETDDVLFLLDKINEAMVILTQIDGHYFSTEATLTLTAGTRLHDLPSGLDAGLIYDNSYKIAGDPIELVDFDNVLEHYPDYLTKTDVKPKFLYHFNNKLGVYPILSTGTLTLNYAYPADATRFTALSDVFPIPDRWLLFIEKYVQSDYEIFKGIGSPSTTADMAEQAHHALIGEAAAANPLRVSGGRVLGVARGYRG